jgi:DNA-binding response OmpR family regulator
MNVLIVEDDVQLIQSMASACREKGWQASLASTGDQAFDELHTGSFNVILLDVMLPGGMNGFDILEELKRRDQWKNIPVIMMTNLDSEEKTARSIGAADYIVKANVSLDEIVERIEKVVSLV